MTEGNTSFRKQSAVLMASEAHRERHGLELNFAPPVFVVPQDVAEALQSDLANELADLARARLIEACEPFQ